MPLHSLVSALRSSSREIHDNDEHKRFERFRDVFLRTWDLGFTSFGGPPVHFQILHRRFVEGVGGKTPWLDEQTYQELFAICQSLPGPGSTKLAFTITLHHAGLLPAFFVFLLWSLPGALGMFALAIGINRVDDVLPAWAYSILSGLNAATVGIIALAAVQLARKAITDPLMRVIVIFSGCAGLCYSALWYFPVLMVISGIATVVWDCWARGKVGRAKAKWEAKRREKRRESEAEQGESSGTGMEIATIDGEQRQNGSKNTSEAGLVGGANTTPASEVEERTIPGHVAEVTHKIPVKVGIAIILLFFVSFAVLIALRSTLTSPPLPLQLFNNFYLAGTVIFGGGPVVIPLLRSYVVDPGWVSPRNFLLGLALIQAFPGPNFNFAVYLGALALSSSHGSYHPSAPTSASALLGAFLGFLGIFTPGITLAIGFQSLWRAIRGKPWVVACLRGINAGAVGLVFTAVYRLWEIGYLTENESRGQSLAREPWWVVVTATSYSLVEWFGVPPPVAILAGGVMGIGWWGAVGR